MLTLFIYGKTIIRWLDTMRLKNCPNCNGHRYYTTKTKNNDIVLLLKADGSFTEVFKCQSEMQPDNPYGMLVCKDCKYTYSLKELLINES